jgi:hypothetical protein
MLAFACCLQVRLGGYAQDTDPPGYFEERMAVRVTWPRSGSTAFQYQLTKDHMNNDVSAGSCRLLPSWAWLAGLRGGCWRERASFLTGRDAGHSWILQYTHTQMPPTRRHDYLFCSLQAALLLLDQPSSMPTLRLPPYHRKLFWDMPCFGASLSGYGKLLTLQSVDPFANVCVKDIDNATRLNG